MPPAGASRTLPWACEPKSSAHPTALAVLYCRFLLPCKRSTAIVNFFEVPYAPCGRFPHPAVGLCPMHPKGCFPYPAVGLCPMHPTGAPHTLRCACVPFTAHTSSRLVLCPKHRPIASACSMFRTQKQHHSKRVVLSKMVPP